MSTMNDQAQADLPAAEGPGVGADQIAAVERNMKALYFLISESVYWWRVLQAPIGQHSQKPIP
jgi:hypothetical protein